MTTTPDVSPAAVADIIYGADSQAPTGADTSPAPGADTQPSGDQTDAGPSTEAPSGESTEPGASTEAASGTDSLTPASYDFTFPEGFTPDTAMLDKFKEVAAEAQLPPELASKMVALYTEAAQAQATAAQAAFQETQAAWLAEVKAMPEFASDAASRDSLAKIGKLLDDFGTPEVRQIFDATGAGNNPHIVSMILKIANAVSEGGPVTPARPTGPAAKPTTLGQAIYGNSTPN